ncbi:MAG: glycosyltransferase [Pseudomonadota bacterium]|nr:glycosyltransferase [Pseudomonadota bacterium]
MAQLEPRILVFSSLFPSAVQPGAGLFIRERMFRVARELPLVVVSPQPYFPGQSLIRRLRPGYRLQAPPVEVQDGIQVYHPRFFSLPGLGRRFDALSMALCSYALLRRLRKAFAFDLIDAHFAYPDGAAAVRLGRWFQVPVTVTLRGTEVPQARSARRPQLAATLQQVTRIFTVSDSLRRLALDLGAADHRVQVVPNGVNGSLFYPVDGRATRRTLGIAEDAKVLITVGGLVERKGFHRVIQVLPELLARGHDVQYLVVGGPCAEGDMEAALRAQVERLGLEDRVHFCGALPPDRLREPLSAADLFVLSSRNEGWANVLLEALSCGLPVVASDVGGNAEVICDPVLGAIVPFGDEAAMCDAISAALEQRGGAAQRLAYAEANQWDARVRTLVEAFRQLVGPQSQAQAQAGEVKPTPGVETPGPG